MYAALGSVTFALQGAPQSLRLSAGEDYAELKLVGRAPKLQAVGRRLREVRLEIVLHSAFARVGSAIAALEQATAARQALPLVLGNGRHLGNYVIAELEVEPTQAMGDGTLVSARARLALREYVAPKTQSGRLTSAPAAGAPAMVPAGTPGASSWSPASPGPISAVAPSSLGPGVTALASVASSASPTTPAASVSAQSAARMG